MKTKNDLRSEVLSLFRNFKVDGVSIPFSLIKYDGQAETFVTFEETDSLPVHSSDNEHTYARTTFDFDVYTKRSFVKVLDGVKKILNENDWTWEDDSPDMYNRDTGFYHKTTSFSKIIFLGG